MIDTHSHIYLEEFDQDRDAVVQRARDAGIEHIILPNVDAGSLPRMLALEAAYPDYCHAAIGLHPTSVAANYKQELLMVHAELERRKWIAVGEIGLDFYWDQTFRQEQEQAFRRQVEWAILYDLPVIIHTRSSLKETLAILADYKTDKLRGVFHCFSGTLEDAEAILSYGGFKLGIGGTVTFKKSKTPCVLRQIALEHLVLETDAPYLAPVPFRGKRNESAYVYYTALFLSELYGCSLSDIQKATIHSTYEIFRLNNEKMSYIF